MAKYFTDPTLQSIVEEYVPSGAFPEAEGRVIIALFAKGKPPDKAEAASCHRVTESMRVISRVDYYLTFWASTWIQMTEDERHVTICHELHHIATNDKGEPATRRHQGDFCEIPEHDKVSQQIASNVPKSKHLNYNPAIEDKIKPSETEEEEGEAEEDTAPPFEPQLEEAAPAESGGTPASE